MCAGGQLRLREQAAAQRQGLGGVTSRAEQRAEKSAARGAPPASRLHCTSSSIRGCRRLPVGHWPSSFREQFPGVTGPQGESQEVQG